METDNRCVTCYWCHSPNSASIRIPVEMTPNTITRSYYSYITRDIYTISEETTRSKHDMIAQNPVMYPDTTVDASDDEFIYDPHTKVCSYNCALAFVKSESANVLYRSSVVLLHQVIDKLYPNTLIVPAQPICVLEEYGGKLTRAEYSVGFHPCTLAPVVEEAAKPKTKPKTSKPGKTTTTTATKPAKTTAARARKSASSKSSTDV